MSALSAVTAKHARGGHRKNAKKNDATRDVASEDDGDEHAGPRGVWAFFIAFGIVLAIIIVIVAWNAYERRTTADANRYNGFDFAQAEGGLWVTRIEARGQPYDIPFYFHPRETEDIPVDPTATDPLYHRPAEVYISVPPDAPSKIVVAGVEVARILGTKYNLFNLNVHSALSRASDTKVDIPVYSCEDATPDRVIVQFVEGSSTAIARWSKNPNCVILQYTDVDESVRVADRFGYMLLKMM